MASTPRRPWPVVAALLVTAALTVSRPLAVAHIQQTGVAEDPWNESETLAPSELAKMLDDGDKPTIVYIGPRPLYRAGHIPGATLHGPAGESDGREDLRRWATALPRAAPLVIYCGCCPMADCPNVRPAFKMLRDMGFTKLRVLILPTSFEKDWVTKGYAVER